MEKINIDRFLAITLNMSNSFDDCCNFMDFHFKHEGSLRMITGELHIDEVFPYYDVELDKWLLFEKEKDVGFEYHAELSEDGLMKVYQMKVNGPDSFEIWNEFKTYIYTPYELCQYVSFANNLPSDKILNKKISYKEWDFKDVIKSLYITIANNIGSYNIIEIVEIKQRISNPLWIVLLSLIKGLNRNEILNKIGDISLNEVDVEDIPFGGWNLDSVILNTQDIILWKNFFKEKNWTDFCNINDITQLDKSEDKISVLFRKKPILPTYGGLDFVFPYLAFELNDNFSSQYFFDFLNYSKNGEIFIYELFNYLFSEKPVDPPKILAPKNFIGQMTHSMSFRENYHEYLEEVCSRNNLKGTEIIDIKEVIKNRRDNFKEFILSKEKSNFLSSLKNPLPFIIEKSFRSFSRSSSELDRQYHANRLYSIILKSIVLYPIQELLFLKTENQFPEIEKILNALKSGTNISDGTWLEWFQNISKLYWDKERLGLKYFNQIFEYFRKHKKLLNDIIPERNDFAHYRKHPKIFQQLLEDSLPILLSELRSALIKIDFILVENLNYTNGRLFVKAKRIVGFETDIETFEFETNLDPKYFESNKFYAHKVGMDYTIPLDPFFSVEFEKIETVKMGVFESFKNGNYQYIYGTETSISS